MKRTREVRLEGASFTAAREHGKLSYWVQVPFAKDWVAAQRLADQDGVIVVSELRVFPKEQLRPSGGVWSRAVASVPRGGLSASLLRSVSIGGHAVAPVVTDWIEAHLQSRPDQAGIAIDSPPAVRRFARRVLKDLSARVEPLQPGTRPQRGRKRTRDRSFYVGIAADYRRLLRESPIGDVAKRMAEERKTNRQTVRTWIHIARNRYGLLPRTLQGRLPGHVVDPSRVPDRGRTNRARSRSLKK